MQTVLGQSQTQIGLSSDTNIVLLLSDVLDKYFNTFKYYLWQAICQEWTMDKQDVIRTYLSTLPILTFLNEICDLVKSWQWLAFNSSLYDPSLRGQLLYNVASTYTGTMSALSSNQNITIYMVTSNMHFLLPNLNWIAKTLSQNEGCTIVQILTQLKRYAIWHVFHIKQIFREKLLQDLNGAKHYKDMILLALFDNFSWFNKYDGRCLK